MLFTDGIPTDDPTAAAAYLRDVMKVKIICVGFGQADAAVLRSIASPSSVIHNERLLDIVTQFDNALNTMYEGLNITIHVDEQNSISFTDSLYVKVRIINQAAKTVPAGTHIQYLSVVINIFDYGYICSSLKCKVYIVKMRTIFSPSVTSLILRSLLAEIITLQSIWKQQPRLPFVHFHNISR